MSKWLKLSLLAVLSLFLANSASAQSGQLVTFPVWRYTPAGAFPASSAIVTICTSSATGQPCSPTLTVYQDSGLTTPVVLVNGGLPPCSTAPQFGCIDGLGNVSFYMTPGPFVYTVTGSGLNPYGPIPGNSSCTAGVTCVALSNVANVINAGQQPGSDIGAKINNSCSSSSGQTVWVPASSAGSYSTALNVTVPCHLIFDQGSWTYTGSSAVLAVTSANGVVIDGAGSCNGQPSGATCVGGTQLVATSTSALGLNINGAPGIIMRGFTVVGPNSGSGVGAAITANSGAAYDVQVRAFGGDGWQINGTRGNSNDFKGFNITGYNNGGYGLNMFGTNANECEIHGYFQTNNATSHNGQVEIASQTNLLDLHTAEQGAGGSTGVTLLSGALWNRGQIYAEIGDETKAVNFNAGASNNFFSLTSQTSFTNSGNNNSIQTNQFMLPEGASGTPGLVFTQDLTTGWYNAGGGSWCFSSLGIATSCLASNLKINGVIQNVGGTATMGLTFKTGSGAGNYTGTNTAAFASVDTTNLCAVITVPTGWKLKVDASATIESATGAVAQSFALADAGTSCTGGGVTALAGTERDVTPPALGTFDVVLHTQYIFSGDGAAHSFSLVAKTSNAADAWGIQNTSATAAPSMTFTLMPSN